MNTVPAEAKYWESYWRNRIADEIAEERIKSQRYFQRDKYGSDKSHILNIYSLCEIIARGGE